jgi:pimeloyl-ACP methyl ester carboxylesterase
MSAVFQRISSNSIRRMDFRRGIMTYGDPRNPPIVFLHGIRLGGKIWKEHALALCNEFHVVTPDLPGHGALADLPFEIPVVDAFLAYIADSVTLRPPLVVGYSLGGYVAMRYATDLPEHTAGLMLTGCSTDVVGYRQALYEIAVALGAQFSPSLLQKVLAVLFQLTLPPSVARTVIPFRFNQRVFDASRKIVCGVQYSTLLAEYGRPVLLVNGEWDLLFRPDETKFARAAGAELVIIRGSDHVAPLRHPAQFAVMVRTFANRVFSAL